MTGHSHPYPGHSTESRQSQKDWIEHGFRAGPGGPSQPGHTDWGSKIKGGGAYEYVHDYLLYIAWPSLASKTDKGCQINREDTPGDHINT